MLALVIALGTFGTAFAAEDNKYTTAEHKVQWLVDNKVVEGRKVNENSEDNDLALDKNITRAEVTKLLVYTLELENLADALKGTVLAFPDVELNHWANGWVNVATTRELGSEHIRLVVGYPDGLFKPENNVTYAELSVMLVRIAKKDLTLKDEAFANAPENWASQWMRWAQEEGILDGLKVLDSDAPATRKDAFVMVYNTMKAIGKTDFNKVKFGDVMGVVSKVQAGIIQLNQDPKMEYKITYSSRVTNGTTWRSISDNSYEPGALVRLIANKDGEIEYIIELGNPVDGAIGDRWFDVADHTVETLDFKGSGRDENEAKATSKGLAFFRGAYFDKITVGGVEANIIKDTRFFVADKKNNALREVKSLDEVFKLYINRTDDIEKVYMGYDTFHARNEAKVIVFGSVEKYLGGTDTRRITGYYNSAYKIETEDTKGVRFVYDFANTNYFPREKYVDKMDVVKLYLNGDKYSQSDWGHFGSTDGYKKLIDYSEDPVYEITDIDLDKREITLYDKFDEQKEYYINPNDASIFLEGQLRKGAHVQVALTEDQTEIDVISVVDKALKGHLPNGVRKGDGHGYVLSISEFDDKIYDVLVAEEREKLSNGTYKYYNKRAYRVHADEADLKILKQYEGTDTELVFSIGKYYGNTPVMYNVEVREEYELPDVLPSKDANIILSEDVNGTYKDGILIAGYGYRLGNGTEVKLYPVDKDGKVLDYFTVNGKKIEGNVITVYEYEVKKVGAIYKDKPVAKDLYLTKTKWGVKSLTIGGVAPEDLQGTMYKFQSGQKIEITFLGTKAGAGKTNEILTDLKVNGKTVEKFEVGKNYTISETPTDNINIEATYKALTEAEITVTIDKKEPDNGYVATVTSDPESYKFEATSVTVADEKKAQNTVTLTTDGAAIYKVEATGENAKTATLNGNSFTFTSLEKDFNNDDKEASFTFTVTVYKTK